MILQCNVDYFGLQSDCWRSACLIREQFASTGVLATNMVSHPVATVIQTAITPDLT